jgi:hypothetical protein
MNEKVDADRAAIQAATRDAQERSLQHLKDYVANREKAFEALAKLDSNSTPTRDARVRLEKARQDLETFVAAIAVSGQATSTSETKTSE